MANQFQPLLDGMESGVRGILDQLIDGTVSDLDGPIREISMRLSLAARRKRMDLVGMCKDQLQLIVLEKELRLRSETEGFLEMVVGVGIDALISGAIGGLGSLRR